MQPILPRFAALAIVALGGGTAFAQAIDSTAAHRDSTTAPASTPVVVPAVATTDTAHKDSVLAIVKSDSTSAPVAVKPDTVLPVAKVDTARKAPATKMAAFDSSHCSKAHVWSVEVGARYGWRLGSLLDEEDRLTRQFKVVLVDKNNDTSNVNPIASGFSYQGALWFKGCCGNQFGAGVEYAQLSEHPISTYSSSLSETFLQQILVTARYRRILPVASKINLQGELAAGYDRTTIHGIPLVAANQDDPHIHLSSSDLAVIDMLHESTAANGIHAEAGLGVEFRVTDKIGLALKAGMNGDKIWRETAISVATGFSSGSNSQSVYTWGWDVGLSASHDF